MLAGQSAEVSAAHVATLVCAGKSLHGAASIGSRFPRSAPYSTSTGLVHRDGDQKKHALPDIVKHSSFIIPGRSRQESILTSVGDPQFSNQIRDRGSV